MKQKLKMLMMSALFLAGVNNAWAKVELKNEAFVEKEVTVKEGKKEKKEKQLLPATDAGVIPGERVTYVISYKNTGAQAATGIVIDNPIPEHMVFDSATNGALVSVDGGKNFGDLSSLQVKDKESEQMRPAEARDVTHVKWKINNAVKPNEEGRVQYIAILK